MRRLALLATTTIAMVVALLAAPAQAATHPKVTFALSTTIADHGQVVDVTGTVAGVPTGSTLRVQRHVAGAWHNVVTTRTAAKGRFSAGVTPVIGPNALRVTVLATRTTAGVSTGTKTLQGRPAVSPANPTSASPLTVTGKLPQPVSRHVDLQTLTGSTWTTVASATSSAAGYVTVGFTASASRTLRLRAPAVTIGGTSYATATSASRDVTVTQPDLAPTPRPTTSGRPVVGATLTAVPGTWGPAPVSLTYQWLRDGQPVRGATASTYTVGVADTDADLSVAVTGTKPGYRPATTTSDAVNVPAVAGVVHLAGTIEHDETWPAVEGRVYVLDDVTIASGATVTVEAGVVVKATAGATLTVDGTLAADDTTSPVVLTTLADDTSGGDTARDGAVTPSSSAWSGVVVDDGGSARLPSADIRYAATALTVHDGGYAVLHGSVARSAFGVVSASTFVDASHVDWGSASGPAPIGTGVGYRGDTTFVAPWVGYPEPSQTASGPAFEGPTTACASTAFIGVRGSGETPGSGTAYSSPEGGVLSGQDTDGSHTADGLGARIGLVYQGFVTRIRLTSRTMKIKKIGLQYPALKVNDNPYNSDVAIYMSSVNAGVAKLYSLLLAEASACPREKLVVAGYSQGAQVIHTTLQLLAQARPDVLTSSQLSAVLLVADPTKVADAQEKTWQSNAVLATSRVTTASGAWDLFGSYDVGRGPLPSTVTGRTLALCQVTDIVCAPGPGSTLDGHVTYSGTALLNVGTWGAAHVLGATPPGP